MILRPPRCGFVEALFYASVRGYEARSIPAYSASSYVQLEPIPQEELTAYESGFKWRVNLWGRNVTNRFCLINVERQQDATIRHTGMPLTYGATFEHNYK